MLALFTGLEENLNSSLLFGQVAFTFCLSGATTYLWWLMILLENDLAGPLSINCPLSK